MPLCVASLLVNGAPVSVSGLARDWLPPAVSTLPALFWDWLWTAALLPALFSDWPRATLQMRPGATLCHMASPGTARAPLTQRLAVCCWSKQSSGSVGPGAHGTFQKRLALCFDSLWAPAPPLSSLFRDLRETFAALPAFMFWDWP